MSVIQAIQSELADAQSRIAESQSAVVTLAKKLAAFLAQAARLIVLPEARIELADGERYAGIMLDADGLPSHHLILLPGATQSLWQAAIDWASGLGGTLPTRREQALLFANLPGEFESAYYWSSEQHADYSGSAWIQTFGSGSQVSITKSGSYRARAVRRLPIQ